MSGRSAPRVVFDQVSVRYGARSVFENLSLVLPAGEWTCLLGASGIGKSTLARLVLGLDIAGETTGAVRIEGHSTAGSSVGEAVATARRVAWMAQQDLLYPWLTVLGNVTLGRRLRGTTESGEARAMRLLEQVGLNGFAKHYPNMLSGGMRQRAALARTLMEDCPVVVLDEPFGSLDALSRATLQKLAFELLAGRTTFLITHDPLEALRLGHQVHVLAGEPAALQEPIVPRDLPLRPVDSDGMAAMHATLLQRLASGA